MKCFIISPIGKPGTPERQHADAVLECIIKPALQEAKIDGLRADEVTDIGKITKQMYDAILTSDFCIAVLHEFNPNVFYELAVAHSAGIPVILLSEQGVDLPFDIKDDRAFQYDLSRKRSIGARTNANCLKESRACKGSKASAKSRLVSISSLSTSSAQSCPTY
jgi:hypothetical protein